MRCARGVAVLLLFPAAFADEAMTKPRYREGNVLFRPEGYRDWKFVGANLGMSYSDGKPAAAPKFHNVYIQPEAFRYFQANGRFPDKTVLVMEVLTAGAQSSINRQGHFQDRFVGIEVALKDEQRFPEKWGYFKFFTSDGKQLDAARPFPKEACWQCHNQHGAADNVFVQFYPVLREARAP